MLLHWGEEDPVLDGRTCMHPSRHFPFLFWHWCDTQLKFFNLLLLPRQTFVKTMHSMCSINQSNKSWRNTTDFGVCAEIMSRWIRISCCKVEAFARQYWMWTQNITKMFFISQGFSFSLFPVEVKIVAVGKPKLWSLFKDGLSLLS